jgi:hypothetical protein
MFEEKSLFYLAELLSYSTFYPRTSNPNILPANSSYYSIYLHMPFQSGFDGVLIFFFFEKNGKHLIRLLDDNNVSKLLQILKIILEIDGYNNSKNI